MRWQEWRVRRAKILLTILYCGLMRISEVLQVRACDISESREYWKIEITKSKKDQDQRGAAIFLAKVEWLDAAIRKCLEAKPEDPILASRNGSRWSTSAAASEIKMCDSAGLRRLSPHSF
ncbi:hypothetical protein ANCDUO_07925 [Ancylostoma duodenale]|uniref:Tyr recombinase domain-containing protein n=1 Tax=Ancylostoma duodenale TaxID=51022 RepID=A0A0C2CXQ4_9BILA|nr:hypothetical protein ANCDUO_07925 [Ancylostoma duodenale]